MATDQSPTQNKLIGTIALLAVFILISLKFILTSYYLEMTEAEAHASLVEPEQLHALQAAQNKDLQQSPVPIDVAMKNLATSGRDNAPPIIAPQQSQDTGPLVGWGKLTRDAGLAPPPPPPAVPMAVDAGAAKADAGRPGVPTAPPAPPTHPPPAVDAGH